MMKRLALIIWMIPWVLTAQTDPAARAAETAWGVMGGRQQALKTRLVQDSVIPFGDPGQPAVFAVTFQPTGFVILSSEKDDNKILGYSLTSVFPADPGHPLRSWLLPGYQAALSNPDNRKASMGTSYFTDQMVLPLASAKWGQGDPWNRFCPADSTGKRALVGCVAVAMSQIMEKWQWPLKGAGEVIYTPLQRSDYGELSVNFDTTRYHWDQTHDIFPTDASALILYQTGVSTYMNYDPALSSTSVDQYAVPALINHFSYNPEMIFRSMEGNISSEWIRMLHQELDNSRPVLYAGTSPDGKSSHAFNIDGYRSGTFFHFNWGWNGAGDGWYSLNGMAGGGSDFSTQQGAIFGLQPSSMPLHDRPSALDILAGDRFVQLFWDQPVIANFSHFNIFRDGVLIDQTSDTRYRDEGVDNGHSYSYEITATYQGQLPGESVPTPAVSVIPWVKILPGYTQTFESGPEGWQLSQSVSGFRTGNASELLTAGNSGNIAAIRSEGHPAGEQVSDFLISPVIYAGEFSHPAISFDYAFRQNPGIDKLTLMWRDFTTGSWQILVQLDSTGGYSDWKSRHFYLPQTSPHEPIQIAFRYDDFFGEGYGAAIDNISFYEVAEPAVPFLTSDLTDLCLAQTLTFTDLSAGTIQTWEWDFGEGAEPRYASTQGPHLVSYTTAGKKTVRLSLNHLDHLLLSDAISIREKPVAGFEYTRKFMDITFTDKSQNAEQLLWLFGDGSTSTVPNPVHTYYSKGFFEISQIAYNGICSPDTLKITIDMRTGTGIDIEEAVSTLTVYPNPTGGKVNLLWNNLLPDPVKIKVLSATGQVFLHQEYPAQKEITLDLFGFPDGIYILQVASGKVIRNTQIIKINN